MPRAFSCLQRARPASGMAHGLLRVVRALRRRKARCLGQAPSGAACWADLLPEARCLGQAPSGVECWAA
eukprot:352664-Chlamydomonas_euryale.AAC.8